MRPGRPEGSGQKKRFGTPVLEAQRGLSIGTYICIEEEKTAKTKSFVTTAAQIKLRVFVIAS